MDADGNKSSKDEETCDVCKNGLRQYKCPTCFIKYCSSGCFKSHKGGGSCTVQETPIKMEEEGFLYPGNTTNRTYYFPTKDTVSREKLEILSTGDNLLRLKEFLHSPDVRSNVLRLDRSSNPMIDFQDAMDNKAFLQFAQFVTNTLHETK